MGQNEMLTYEERVYIHNAIRAAVETNGGNSYDMYRAQSAIMDIAKKGINYERTNQLAECIPEARRLFTESMGMAFDELVAMTRNKPLATKKVLLEVAKKLYLDAAEATT